MQSKKLLWGLVGLIVVAVVGVGLGVGFNLTQNDTANQTATDNNTTQQNQTNNTQTGDTTTEGVTGNAAISVNSKTINQLTLEMAYQNLLRDYRSSYAQQEGGNLDEYLQDSDGAYYQLQIRYQAAQRLINDALIAEEIRERDIIVDEAVIEAAYQQEYRDFLDSNGLTTEGLEEILRDSRQRETTQLLLGFTEDSVLEIQARMLRENESNLLRQALLSDILPSGVDASTSEGQAFVRNWLDNLQSGNIIVYHDPLLHAYDLESRVDDNLAFEEQQKYLDEAIAAYETAKNDPDYHFSDEHLDFFMGRLYTRKVNLNLQAQNLIAQAESNLNPDQAGEIEEEIERNRFLAAQSLADYDASSNEQFEALLGSDPGNPVYYYLYARYLLNQGVDQVPIRHAQRMLYSAIERDPEYVDAHVLMGELNIIREFYLQSIEDFEKAAELYEVVKDSDKTYKTNDNDLESIERKWAEAYIWRIAQIDQFFPEEADERAANIVRAGELLNGLKDRMNPNTDSDYPFVLTDLGDLAMVEEDPVTAQAHYKASIKLNDKDHEVYEKLGRAYYMNEQYEDAIASFETSIDMDETFAKAYHGLAKVYTAQGNLEQAQLAYQNAFKFGMNLTYTERRLIALEALEVDPTNSQMRLLLSDYYLERHVYEGAVKQYNALLEQNSNAVEAYKGLGQVAQERLKYDEALEYFNKALTLGPTPVQQIAIYKLISETDQSKAGPGQPMAEDGKNALYRMALLYLNEGQLTNSWQTLQRLRERYPLYRVDEVKQISDQLAAVVGDNLPGSPVEDLGSDQIAPGESHPGYNSVPPTSGWHYTVPTAWGIHNEPIENEVQLRNLASGGILIQYHENTPEGVKQSLIDFVVALRDNPTYCQVILAPHGETFESNFALTAWNRIYQLDTFEESQLLVFIDTFIGRGPEAGEVSCNL